MKLLGGLTMVPVNEHVCNGDQGISSTANSLTLNSPYGTDQHVLIRDAAWMPGSS